jgi:hypothetical protein
MILPCLLSDKLASDCECLRAIDAKRLIHNVVFTHLERAGVDTQTSRALFRDNAAELGEAVHGLGGACTPWLEGYRVKVLDGNCIETTHYRLKPLRGLAAGALPGKSLGIYDPQLEMAIDVFPCEDGHAQERALLGEVLLRVQAKDLFVVDRNFCVREMLFGIDARGRLLSSAANTRDCLGKPRARNASLGKAKLALSTNNGFG